MSAHVIRLSLVALLAGFYYAVCVALGLSSIVTIVVVVYAVLAGVLTMTLAVAPDRSSANPRYARLTGRSAA